MPRTSSRKRKSDDFENIRHLGKKLRKLERKIMRGKRRIVESSSSETSRETSPATERAASAASSASEDRVADNLKDDYCVGNLSVRNELPRLPVVPTRRPSATMSTPAAVDPRGPGPRAAAAPPPPPPPPPAPDRAALAATSELASLSEAASTAAAAATAAPAPVLDDELLQLLGEDPSSAKSFGKDIQKDLAVRLEHMATNGLSKELRKELKERYLIPANCTLIDAPMQNPEIQAAVNEATSKRLKAIELKQKLVGSAIACLAEMLTQMLADKDKNNAQLKLLMDACRILCDVQYGESLTRRGFILSAVKKEMRDRLKDRKIDKYIFGDNLLETLKAAKAIDKTGAELKLIVPGKPETPEKTKPYLSRKGSPSSRQSSAPQRTQAPPATGRAPDAFSRDLRPRPSRSRR